MPPLLRDAEQLLTAATLGNGNGAEAHAICVNRQGGIWVVTAPQGWSLPALAQEQGADAVYLVERRKSDVRVEAWSPQENFVLVRKLPPSASGAPAATQSWMY